MARKNLLKGFKRPKGITFERVENNPNYGKFTAYPFEPGFGTTMGNTLRRVLLSSIQGYAISSVRITTYDHDPTTEKELNEKDPNNNIPPAGHVISNEFEAIPNISEDTLEVMNSLKQIRLRLPDGVEENTFTYSFYNSSGQRFVKSDDFAKEGQLEIMSKGIDIFTQMEGSYIDMEIQVDLGRGYVSAEDNSHYVEDVVSLPMDCIFSPVSKVKYSIEPCRVGSRNDYDKLVLEIWTDGTVSPENALSEAAKITKEFLTVFVNFDESEYSAPEEIEEIDEETRKFLDSPVEELELNVRCLNCFKNADIKTIRELTRKTEEDITKTRNFGKKSLEEIKARLAEHGLHLGMTDYSHVNINAKMNKDQSK